LAMHTDGVGTKVLVAQELGRFDTIGIDCVAMTVNDLICLGAEPVALLDYIALEKEDHQLVADLSRGIAAGAKESGAAVVGGETAIVGDLLRGVAGRGFDLVSMGVGVVRKKGLVDGSAIRQGDEVLGIASSGLHSNGYTLARRIVRGRSLADEEEALGESIGAALLKPTRIYVRPTLEAIKRHEVHGVAHITGGGFTKLTRLTGRRKLRFDLGALPRGPSPAIFEFLRREGRLTAAEMYGTFNMGVGLCLVVPTSEVDGILRTYKRMGFDGRPIGSIERGEGVTVGRVSIARGRPSTLRSTC